MQVVQDPTLAASSSFTISDPTVNSASVAVQLQNLSGFNLIVNNGEGEASIGPNMAATFASFGGAPINIIVVGQGPSGGGLIEVWLLPQDTNPQPDGPINATAPIPSATPIQSVANAITSTGGGTAQLIAYGTAPAFRLWDLTLSIAIASGGGGGQAGVAIAGGGPTICFLRGESGPIAVTKHMSFLPYGLPIVLTPILDALEVVSAGAASAAGEVVYSIDFAFPSIP